MHKVVLLRHGESTWNKENRFTGWTDVPLTDKGRTEARFLDSLEAMVDAGHSPGTAVREQLGNAPGRGAEARRAFARAFYFAGVEP